MARTPFPTLQVAPIPSLSPDPSCLRQSQTSPLPQVSSFPGDYHVTRRDVSDDVRSDRLLAYKPFVSPDAKRGPVRLNTKGQAPSGRYVGKLADVLKMPLNVFCEVSRRCSLAYVQTNSFGIDCLTPPPIGHPSTRTRVFEAPCHFDVEELGPYLDRREAGDRYARMSP